MSRNSVKHKNNLIFLQLLPFDFCVVILFSVSSIVENQGFSV